MKTLIIILALLTALDLSAQVASSIGPGKSIPYPTKLIPPPHNHPPTPLLFETFDSVSGFDLPGWAIQETAPGDVNADYTATILHGTQSFLSDANQDDNPNYATNNFAATGHVYGFFMLRVLRAPSSGEDDTIMQLRAVDNSCQLHITLNSDMDFKIHPHCDTAFITGFGLSLNTTYRIWWEWNKDNGANSFASLAYSTTQIRPTSGDQYVDGTFSQVADNPTIILFGADNGSDDPSFIVDYVLIDDVQILDYP